MRNANLGFLSGLALAAMAVGAACSNGSGGSNPPGGAGQSSAAGAATTAGAANGAGGNTGSGGSCASVSACGGSVVGSWTVASSCLKLSGPMDVSILSLACPTVPVTGSVSTTGSFTANADGTYTDNTRTTGSATFPLAASCLSVSSVPVACAKTSDLFKVLGWTTSTCTDTNGQCNCSLTVDRPGGIGFVSDLTLPQGNYTTANNTLKVDDLSYSYCSTGDTLTLTPLFSSVAGTVVLTKGSVSGAGGAAGGGSGGSAGSGGASVSAGTGGTGAAAGQGGKAGSSSAGSGAGGSAGGTATGSLPCDIYAAANTACVAAHSTIRALLKSYSGNLYQVKRASDGTTKDIPVLAPGGFADSQVQDTFCAGTTCTITRLYDQSGHNNFLQAETPDVTLGEGANAHPGHTGMTAASATAESLMVGGHKVYSLYTKPSQAYWNDGSKTGMPTGSAPQGIYIVTSGKHFNGGCCYDYGNGEVSRLYVAGPSMDALYFGSSTQWGTGNGAGPWVMADMEDGMLSQGSGGKNNNLLSQTSTYVTAMEKNNGTSDFALKAADATAPTLNTYYSGTLPGGKKPMKKQGAIVLGSGGDCCYSNSNASQGTFYEGAIVAGYPSDATDNAIHANIVSAGYGK
ncbi:MAG TPA: arabinofuranosidase catalytic domain-containing protein [Polyangiaceae bacterium]|nr:arabinofuranosidase catalytic domain-containing protein [Polyangiaceae bacterium]